MADASNMFKPDQILEIALRRRWLIIIPFCLALVVGIYLSITLPKLYQASTLILIQPQKVPSNFVQSIVSTDMESRISTISQQIMSRSNLEKIIERFGLFKGTEAEKMFFEDKINTLRNRIAVDVTRARKGADAFSISYTGKEPEKVMRIANTLASFFIDENLKLREASAVGTSNFLDVELQSMRERLEKNEAELKNYRERYMGGLPEQLDTNLRVLDRLQEQLGGKQEALRDAQNRLDAFDSQVAEIEKLRDAIVAASTDDIMKNPETDSLLKLAQLREQLAYLKTKYTDQHPDIKRLESTIKKLEAQITVVSDENSVQSKLNMTRQEYIQKKRRDDIINEINGYKDDIAAIQDQTEIYQKRVEDTPKREQELLTLKRDYQNIMESYNSLLGRKLEAEMAVNMEKKQKGEQFRIIDPARLPEKPISPNMRRLFLMVIAVGLGIGGCLTYGFEYIDQSFRRPDDVESYLGLPVIATIKLIHQPGHALKKRLMLTLSILSVFVTIALLMSFTALTLKGVDKTVGFIRQFI